MQTSFKREITSLNLSCFCLPRITNIRHKYQVTRWWWRWWWYEKCHNNNELILPFHLVFDILRRFAFFCVLKQRKAAKVFLLCFAQLWLINLKRSFFCNCLSRASFIFCWFNINSWWKEEILQPKQQIAAWYMISSLEGEDAVKLVKTWSSMTH